MINRFPLTLMICFAAGSWALLLSANGWVIPHSFFAPLSGVVSVLSVGLMAFDRWLWSLPGINRLVDRPRLKGTWKGTLHSSWVDPAGLQKVPPIEAYVVIRQTYSTLHVRLFTLESQSITLTATIMRDADEQYSLAGIYSNEPNLSVRERSPIHFGGIRLRIEGQPPMTLSGMYWTDRNTRGEMRFERVSDALVHDFQEARALPKPAAR